MGKSVPCCQPMHSSDCSPTALRWHTARIRWFWQRVGRLQCKLMLPRSIRRRHCSVPIDSGASAALQRKHILIARAYRASTMHISNCRLPACLHSNALAVVCARASSASTQARSNVYSRCPAACANAACVSRCQSQLPILVSGAKSMARRRDVASSRRHTSAGQRRQWICWRRSHCLCYSRRLKAQSAYSRSILRAAHTRPEQAVCYSHRMYAVWR